MKKSAVCLAGVTVFWGVITFMTVNALSQGIDEKTEMRDQAPVAAAGSVVEKKQPEAKPVPAAIQQKMSDFEAKPGREMTRPADSLPENRYVGVDKCAACHAVEFSDYKKRKFQKSWKILKMRGEEGNSECLKCHSTGFGKGGFKSESETPHLSGKQCEACHGPGGNHISNPANPDFREELKVVNKKNVCIECHACMSTHKSTDF